MRKRSGESEKRRMKLSLSPLKQAVENPNSPDCQCWSRSRCSWHPSREMKGGSSDSHQLKPGLCLCRRADEKPNLSSAFLMLLNYCPLSVVRRQLQRTTDNGRL